MNLYRELVTDVDAAQMRAALAAAEDDRDRAQELAELRLRRVEELEAQLRNQAAELEQLRGEVR